MKSHLPNRNVISQYIKLSNYFVHIIVVLDVKLIFYIIFECQFTKAICILIVKY